MSYRRVSLGLAVAVLVLSASVFAEPKAYELFQYRGKSSGVTIEFDYGQGYVEASSVRIREAGQRKIQRFRLADGADETAMRFVPANGPEGDREVVLKLPEDENSPDVVEGTYRANGKTIVFKLKPL